MKSQSILLFAMLLAIFGVSNFISCHKSVPENKGTPEYMIMQFLSHNPHAVRTKAVEKGYDTWPVRHDTLTD